MKFGQTDKIIKLPEDDWGSVLDAYGIQELDAEATTYNNDGKSEESLWLQEIKQKYAGPKSVDLDYELQLHLIYNASMAADILTDSTQYNKLMISRYTMSFQHIPKSLFEKFVNQECLDHSKCDYVRHHKDSNPEVFEVSINVRQINEGQDFQVSVDEVFKFTC